MIERKVLKSKAKVVVKKHYWQVVAICFIIAFVTGDYLQGGTLTLLSTNASEEAATEIAADISQSGQNNTQIIRDIIATITNDNKEVVGGEREEELRAKYNRGVFSSLFNNITGEGSVVLGILNVVNQGVFKGEIVAGLLLLLGIAITAAFTFFISNMLRVGQRRYFMEATYYDKTSSRRVLFLINIRRWFRACLVMFFTSLYQILWNLTIVGGIIKSYSYQMVPYIIAENPNVTRKEAITLSRKMMDGYKWQSFKVDLSFLGWNILGAATFGVLSIFYINPYRTATEAQLYYVIRKAAIDKKVAGYELLNDVYLEEQPIESIGQTEVLERYPVDKFSIPESPQRKIAHADYMRKYSLRSIILLFFIFSIVGWVWEVSLHLAQGGFVNRGTLHGPWLPIYGSGGVLILILLQKVRQKPWLTFILTIVTCGILEYLTSWYLETFKGHKWWDYSGYLLNINGRICAEGLLVFALGGCAFIYILAPMLDDLIKKIPVKVQIAACIVLLSSFIVDSVYSSKHPNTGTGITDYASIQTVPYDGIEETLKSKGFETGRA